MKLTCSKRISRAIALLITSSQLLSAALPVPALAALGASAESVHLDAVPSQSLITTTQRSSFTIMKISAPNGSVISEFLNLDGTVFAASWRGLRPPDLSLLLGSYFPEFQSAALAQQGTARRGHLRVASKNLVVESGGHMRDVIGSAYIPALMPSGLTIGDLK